MLARETDTTDTALLLTPWGGRELPAKEKVTVTFKDSCHCIECHAEYRWDDGAGSSWFVAFENESDSSWSASVVVECVQSDQLPLISYHYVDLTRGSDGYAEGSVSCLNPGEVVLTGGAGWNNVNYRTVDYSGPTWSGDAWIAKGYNSVSGAKLTVEVYCVNPSDVPGFERVELDYGGTSDWRTSITCGTDVSNTGTRFRRSIVTAVSAEFRPCSRRATC